MTSGQPHVGQGSEHDLGWANLRARQAVERYKLAVDHARDLGSKAADVAPAGAFKAVEVVQAAQPTAPVPPSVETEDQRDARQRLERAELILKHERQNAEAAIRLAQCLGSSETLALR